MRILFATQLLPFPTNSGARLRTSNLIKLLMSDHEVKCVFFPYRRQNHKQFLELCPENIKYSLVYPLNKNLLVRGYEYFSSPIRRDGRIVAELENLIDEFKPELVWLDYFFIGQYISLFNTMGIPVVYGTHNAQSKLTKQQASAEKRVLNKIKYSIMSILHGIHERIFFPQAHSVVCVSDQDANFYSSFIHTRNITVLPNFIDLDSYSSVPAFRSEAPYICFVGSLDNFQNARGIKFFISEVWEKVLQHVKVQLLIVGRGFSGNDELKTLVERNSNIKVYEDVDSVVPFLKGSLASIVPLLHGSGTRLKIVESMACNTPIISTSIGAEGIGAVDGKDILIADTKDEFSRQIVRIVQDESLRKSIAENAYKLVAKQFGFDAARTVVDKLVET